jgi:hypothetical protein
LPRRPRLPFYIWLGIGAAIASVLWGVAIAIF